VNLLNCDRDFLNVLSMIDQAPLKILRSWKSQLFYRCWLVFLLRAYTAGHFGQLLVMWSFCSDMIDHCNKSDNVAWPWLVYTQTGIFLSINHFKSLFLATDHSIAIFLRQTYIPRTTFFLQRLFSTLVFIWKFENRQFCFLCGLKIFAVNFMLPFGYG